MGEVTVGSFMSLLGVMSCNVHLCIDGIHLEEADDIYHDVMEITIVQTDDSVINGWGTPGIASKLLEFFSTYPIDSISEETFQGETRIELYVTIDGDDLSYRKYKEFSKLCDEYYKDLES